MDDKKFPKTKISPMTTDYLLRTYTAGCYYLDEKYEEWTGQVTINDNSSKNTNNSDAANVNIKRIFLFVKLKLNIHLK